MTLLGRPGSLFSKAERRFNAAIRLAQKQGARAIGLRATTSLARLGAGDQRQAEAADLLATSLAGFSEGFETEDLVVARRWLKALRREPGAAA